MNKRFVCRLCGAPLGADIETEMIALHYRVEHPASRSLQVVALDPDETWSPPASEPSS